LAETPPGDFSVFLRIPAWSRKQTITINGEEIAPPIEAGTYHEIRRKWKAGDEILLNLGMEPFLVESHPLVEENQNLVAVQMGPVVYCLESADLPEGIRPSDVLMPVRGSLDPVPVAIGKQRMLGLETEARVRQGDAREHALYQRLEDHPLETAKIRLIPYYAWGNREAGDMSVWLPVQW
jgi:DUF1680 family protein